ncbi:MAG: hypothetical protein D6824_07820, partial [Planctomycetota bacterium]
MAPSTHSPVPTLSTTGSVPKRKRTARLRRDPGTLLHARLLQRPRGNPPAASEPQAGQGARRVRPA